MKQIDYAPRLFERKGFVSGVAQGIGLKLPILFLGVIMLFVTIWIIFCAFAIRVISFIQNILLNLRHSLFLKLVRRTIRNSRQGLLTTKLLTIKKLSDAYRRASKYES